MFDFVSLVFGALSVSLFQWLFASLTFIGICLLVRKIFNV